MGDKQITIVCLIRAKPQARQTVREELLALAKSTRAERGNINYDLHVCDADERLFIIYENWQSQAALDRHMNEPHLRRFLEMAPTLLDQPIDGKLCTKL